LKTNAATRVADRAGDVISCLVRSLITLFVLAALVLAQGTSLAASVCRHASLMDHIAARQSHDPGKAAIAVAEETAAAVDAKKGSPSSNGSVSPPADLLPPSTPAALLCLGESVPPCATDRPPLVGISVRPPLPPPLA
jgi:hypothetical protein